MYFRDRNMRFLSINIKFETGNLLVSNFFKMYLHGKYPVKPKKFIREII